MVSETNQTNARGLAIAAVAISGIWALATFGLGVAFLVSGLHNYQAIVPFGGAPGPPGSGDDIRFELGMLVTTVWVATVNGMVAAAVMGSIAIRRARASWVRVIGYCVVVFGGVALAVWWWIHDFVGNSWPPDDRGVVIKGLGLILTAMASVGVGLWILMPALRRHTSLLPPPDPSTLLYSDRTT